MPLSARYLRAADVCTTYSISGSTLTRLRKSGAVRALLIRGAGRPGNRYRYDAESVRAYFEREQDSEIAGKSLREISDIVNRRHARPVG